MRMEKRHRKCWGSVYQSTSKIQMIKKHEKERWNLCNNLKIEKIGQKLMVIKPPVNVTWRGLVWVWVIRMNILFFGLGLGRRICFSNFSSTVFLVVGFSFLVVLILVVKLMSYMKLYSVCLHSVTDVSPSTAWNLSTPLWSGVSRWRGTYMSFTLGYFRLSLTLSTCISIATGWSILILPISKPWVNLGGIVYILRFYQGLRQKKLGCNGNLLTFS